MKLQRWFCWVTYWFLYAMFHNDTCGCESWGGEGEKAITNDVLKFIKVMEFESFVCNLLLLYLSHHRWKNISHQLKKVVKNLRN